jgi:hypothetical protein
MRLLVACLTFLSACEIAHSQRQALSVADEDAGTDIEELCEPGAVKSCFCAIGEPQGERQCREDGSGWEPCDCPGLPDAGAPGGDAGELADAAVDVDAAVDAAVEPAPGEFWAPCETREDCTGKVPNGPVASIRLGCISTDRVGEPGKRCTFSCWENSSTGGMPCEEACEYTPCTNLGGSCQLVDHVSGTTVSTFFACVP